MRSLALISTDSFCLLNYKGDFIRALVRQGIGVHALARHDDIGRARLRSLGAVPVDISLSSTGINPFRDALDILRLARTLRRLRVDTAFSFFTKPMIYGSLAARLAGTPRRFAMVSGLGFAFTSQGWKQRLLRPILRALYRLALRPCARVFFENDEDLGYFEQGLIRRGTGSRISGCGVNLDRFRPGPFPGTPTFLLIGRMLREKGVREFVAAARDVRRRHPGVRFILLGGLVDNPGGLSREELALLIGGGIEWHDHVPDVRPWIAASSVFVLPSYREGLPRSTLEAMAMGRAIITTDAVGCRETVEEGRNGFLVPARDARALGEAMMRFIDDPGLAGRLGGASRALAERRFDVERVDDTVIRAMTG